MSACLPSAPDGLLRGCQQTDEVQLEAFRGEEVGRSVEIIDCPVMLIILEIIQAFAILSPRSEWGKAMRQGFPIFLALALASCAPYQPPPGRTAPVPPPPMAALPAGAPA